MGREARVPREQPKSVKKRRPDFYVKVYPVQLRRTPLTRAKALT